MFSYIKPLFCCLLLALLSGCKMDVLRPSGDIAAQQRDILVISTGLMLLIVIPVMALTVYFAWRYRAGNKAHKDYDPNWDHSTQLELLIWSAPLAIIICLGAMTWLSTHLLDPFRPIGRITEGRSLDEKSKALEIDAVALDWKWLFIYPQEGIATINEVAAPVDRPVDFHITSSSVMNSFFIPSLAGQIYAMPAMETKLRAVMNVPGDYRGISANYSGDGFSGMHFTLKAVDQKGFDTWVSSIKSHGGSLTRDTYLTLEQPSENNPVQGFAEIDRTLFGAIMNMCVERGKMCLNKMAAIDAHGGLGLKGITNLLPLSYDKFARRGAVFGPPVTNVANLCTPVSLDDVSAQLPALMHADTTPLHGAALPLLSNP